MTLGASSGKGDGGARSQKKRGSHATDGAVVTETGIALVHEGELIFPALGSEAEADLAISDARSTITINLPVIVQVLGGRDGAETDRVVDETLRRLRVAIEAESQVT